VQDKGNVMVNEAYKFNTEHAIEAKRKFNYFFIGLTFSVLALAINHSIETKMIFPRITELLGWASLLVSGGFGLWGLEYEGEVFGLAATLAKKKELREQFEEIKEKGTALHNQETLELIDTDEEITGYTNEIEGIYEKLIKIDDGSKINYRVQKWCFLFGMVSLSVSYSYPKICIIYQQIAQ
jgi:hypothetical protein